MKTFYLKFFSVLMLAVLVISSVTSIVTAAPAAASGSWIAQTYVHGPPDNVLKGFMPYQGSYSTFPYSMEWNYIAWSDVQTGPTSYNWGPIDSLLNDVASRGHQTVFRIYADYPGRAYAVPGFLSGVAKNSYTDYGNTTSFSPNYDDPNLLSAMTNLISAMGARYDGDPRIGFITVGFIGFWGEWHTYRNSCACDTWMPTTATQNTVLTTFDNAFNKTKILLRYPMGNSPSMNIGYHDDSFNYSTYGATSYYFWPKITAAGVQNKWQTEAIGGEMYPDIQLTTWNSSSLCVTGGAGDQQCFNNSVDTTHASWMIAHQLFSPGNSGTAHTYALAGAQRMGYDLFVSSVALPDTTTSGNLQVSIKLQDKGVAPFYYPWTVQIGVANSSNSVVATWNTTWDLTTVKDASDHQFDFTKSGHGLAAGSYKLLMRAVNPLSNGKPLVFANQKWGQDVANWLTLDTFTVSSGGATNTPGPTATKTNTPAGPTNTPTRTPTKTNTPTGPTATPTTGASLLLDNFDGSPAWPGGNDLGQWAGANSFVNGGGSGVLSGGALVLQYNNTGTLDTNITQNISAYTYLVFVIKGAAGGEQNHFRVNFAGANQAFGTLSGDTITTAYKTIRINMVTAGMNRASPGPSLQLLFNLGGSGTVTIDEIRFE